MALRDHSPCRTNALAKDISIGNSSPINLIQIHCQDISPILAIFSCMECYFLLYYNKDYHLIQKGARHAKEPGCHCHLFPQIPLYRQRREHRQSGGAMPIVHPHRLRGLLCGWGRGV